MKKICLAICLASSLVAAPAYARGDGLGDRCASVESRNIINIGLCWWFDNFASVTGKR